MSSLGYVLLAGYPARPTEIRLRPTSGDVTLAHVRMHADQMAVPDATVRALIAEQFPRWQALPVRRIASQGTVNAIFRIGDDLAALRRQAEEEHARTTQLIPPR